VVGATVVVVVVGATVVVVVVGATVVVVVVVGATVVVVVVGRVVVVVVGQKKKKKQWACVACGVVAAALGTSRIASQLAVPAAAAAHTG